MSEQKVYEPNTGEIELDVGDAEAVEVEIAEAESPAESEPRETSEHERVSESAQARINRLTKKMRDAQRREQEALSYAKQVQAEAEQLRTRMTQVDQGYLQEYGSRLATETQIAEAEMKRAVEIGDSAKVVESQRRLAQLYAAAEKYTTAKQQQEAYAEQVKAAQGAQILSQETQVQQPQQAPARRPDPKAEQWAQRNTWFGQDEVMTFATFGLHKKLVAEEGFDPESDEYYTELDRRLREEFPHKLSGSSKRAVQTVVGVSRANSVTTPARSKKVRLTPTQVAVAKKLGVPLELYAKYVKE
jgi:hypothetical protein